MVLLWLGYMMIWINLVLKLESIHEFIVKSHYGVLPAYWYDEDWLVETIVLGIFNFNSVDYILSNLMTTISGLLEGNKEHLAIIRNDLFNVIVNTKEYLDIIDIHNNRRITSVGIINGLGNVYVMSIAFGKVTDNGCHLFGHTRRSN